MNRKDSTQQTTHDTRESVPAVSSVAMPAECVMTRIRLNLNAFFRSRATLITAAGNNESRAPLVTGIVSKEKELSGTKAYTCFEPNVTRR